MVFHPFIFSLTDVYPVRDVSHATGLKPLCGPGGAVQWTGLAAVQAQLHNQQQVKITTHPTSN